MRKIKKYVIPIAVFLCLILTSCSGLGISSDKYQSSESSGPVSIDEIPEYSGEPYVEINGNAPQFDTTQLGQKSFERYSDLDDLGRCGTAYANIGQDIMPTEERGEIGRIKPSGWQTAKYDFIDGKYLYNRCHLIGFQLAGENDNEKNLITGTRYMNVVGMLPFENMVADYVKETDNHVRYRVTPIYDGDNLVASGVQIEALSVEDEGDGICFNVFCYNVQPGVDIDYAAGDNKASDVISDESGEITYILNTNNRKFHDPSCSSVKDIKDENKQEYYGTREMLVAQGYEPCGRCNP